MPRNSFSIIDGAKIGLSMPQIQNITNLSRATIWRWVKKYDWIHEVTPKVKQSAGINYHH
ncbi:MAG: hypothetical protein E7101_14000 [Prevotella ruminicola]|uniref:Homeodomain-like domain-containing protein n=1 Tax=Xylanibacter ruminicola TaxID=839 RepID=A0A9D5P749_XYLRU|nr:hypothetical protein [Xylanibacter ruminicola]